MIEGTTNIRESYNVSKRFFETLKSVDLLMPGNSRNINNRPKNLKATKIGRRMNMKPAPDVTRRGATCPPKKRPVPYSFHGKCPDPNHYVRPNPQGQPCCYRIPKRLAYMKNRVAKRYEKAGVRVPENVRKLFDIINKPNLPNNVSRKKPEIKTFVNQKSGFMIDSRQCSRYTKVGLVDIAKRLGLNVPSVITKPKLCDMIKQATEPARRGAKNLSMGANGLKLGGRYCMSYKKSTLLKYAKAMGAPGVTNELTKEEICKAISDKNGLNIRNKLAKLYSAGNKSVTRENINTVKKLIANAGNNANKNKIIRNYVAKQEKKLNNLLSIFV